MITAPELEIAVLILGMVILMFEAFAATMDKRLLASREFSVSRRC